jgi:cell wall-associated NlpC family hydrolase
MQTYGYCHLSCIPVRAEASDKSEMVNQLLFGETFEIIDAIKNWKVIRGTLDHYEGFIDVKQFLPIGQEDFRMLKTSQDQFAVKPISNIIDSRNKETRIMPASSLAGFKNGALQLGNYSFSYSDEIIPPSTKVTGDDISKTALQYLNAPYLWGGRSLFGIDCSGLVQNVFKINGINLNRDASIQSQKGETLNLIIEAAPGDLVFFDNEEGEIIHVGIILADGKIIHASGCVRIDEIDHNGIFNKQLNKYTHKLRLIKRVI